jgi:hypothetical protein
MGARLVIGSASQPGRSADPAISARVPGQVRATGLDELRELLDPSHVASVATNINPAPETTRTGSSRPRPFRADMRRVDAGLWVLGTLTIGYGFVLVITLAVR